MTNSVQRLIDQAKANGLKGRQVNDYVHGQITEQVNAREEAARQQDENTK